ncbi:hypothetical protein ACLKA7_011543 [Drosophila subpalustris]
MTYSHFACNYATAILPWICLPYRHALPCRAIPPVAYGKLPAGKKTENAAGVANLHYANPRAAGGRAWATLGHPWNEILVSSVSHSGVHHLTPPEEDDLASQSELRGSGGTMRTTQRVSGVPSSSS